MSFPMAKWIYVPNLRNSVKLANCHAENLVVLGDKRGMNGVSYNVLIYALFEIL